MERFQHTDAVILKTARFGEIHKSCVLLTAGTGGLIYANAYGACKGKSKLAGCIQPFASIHADLYYDPVKRSYKIKDAGFIESFEGIKNSLRKYYVASVVSELALKAYGGGEEGRLYTLVLQAFRSLDSFEEDLAPFILVQFFWKFLSLSGFLPQSDNCCDCGRDLAGEKECFFIGQEAGFACSSCALRREYPLSAGGIQYLAHTRDISFDQALRVRVDKKTLGQIRNILVLCIESILEAPLQSLLTMGELL